MASPNFLWVIGCQPPTRHCLLGLPQKLSEPVRGLPGFDHESWSLLRLRQLQGQRQVDWARGALVQEKIP